MRGAETELVDDDQVGAEEDVDDLGHAVVGKAPVEGFDEVGGGEVAGRIPAVTASWPRARRTTAGTPAARLYPAEALARRPVARGPDLVLGPAHSSFSLGFAARVSARCCSMPS